MVILLSLLMSIAHASELNCNDIKTFKTFYYCSLERHPKFEIAKLKSKEGDAIVEKATQWQNPEFGLKSTTGSNAGETVGATELEVSFSISQLWQREEQKQIAVADKKIANIEAKESLLSVQKELIKTLYRLRQIESELDLVAETINTFEMIKKQYRSRAVRGPEQEITLNLVELASSDYELKRNHLSTEKSELDSKLKAMWGPGFVVKKDYLPPLRERWMEVSLVKSMGTGFELQRINAEKEKALAEQRLATKESYPSLSFGPNLARNTQGPSQYYTYGVNLRMSLPLVSLNSGSRLLSASKAQQAQLTADYANNRAQAEKEILIQKYKSSVESLRKTSNQEEIKRKHQKIDGLFRQGLASGGLIIEAHRQIVEYTESQHEHENAAIEAYLEIKTLIGEGIEDIFQ
ncbi:MAG: hypothetical protein BroJett040_08130 [Oligoflexia bacterium]|nr:MAG: hypothetical protein BroJett040_08130 [Oligoflexia bacterium]